METVFNIHDTIKLEKRYNTKYRIYRLNALKNEDGYEYIYHDCIDFNLDCNIYRNHIIEYISKIRELRKLMIYENHYAKKWNQYEYQIVIDLLCNNINTLSHIMIPLFIMLHNQKHAIKIMKQMPKLQNIEIIISDCSVSDIIEIFDIQSLTTVKLSGHAVKMQELDVLKSYIVNSNMEKIEIQFDNLLQAKAIFNRPLNMHDSAQNDEYKIIDFTKSCLENSAIKSITFEIPQITIGVLHQLILLIADSILGEFILMSDLTRDDNKQLHEFDFNAVLGDNYTLTKFILLDYTPLYAQNFPLPSPKQEECIRAIIDRNKVIHQQSLYAKTKAIISSIDD